jgi:hypothetical protein
VGCQAHEVPSRQAGAVRVGTRPLRISVTGYGCGVARWRRMISSARARQGRAAVFDTRSEAMSVTQDLSQELLAELIQTSFHHFEDATPVVTPLRIPGVRAQVGPTTANPQLNAVGMARLDEATADAAIAAVIDRFAAEGKGFGWLVGPSSTPADLGARLEAAGVEKFAEAAGVALTDLAQPIPTNPDIRIEEVGFAELRQATDMMATAFGFGLTAEDMTAFVDALEALEGRHHSRTYLAFADDRDEPVAFSYMTSTEVPGVAYFPLAATLAEHRGSGIYRSLVARRIADARADGAHAVVTQAVRETSAPILRRISFTELCALELYAWMPADA